MATQHATDEAEIRHRIEELVEAIRHGDLDSLRPVFAAEMVSFDVGPPLQHIGVEAKLKNWREAFTTFQPPLGYEVRDLKISVSGDLAFAFSLNRLSGKLKNGTTGGGWVRATYCFRKIDGNWMLVHDHISVPLDPRSGRAMVDLEP